MTAPFVAPVLTERLRTLITPEGVGLKLEIAGAGQRLAALMIDLGIILGTVIGVTLAALFAAFSAGRAWPELVLVIWLVGMFALRNAYFLFFELSPRAATPGKRILGLRIASRDGGRLTTEAVFARNVMRELEVFLPITVMLSGGGKGGVDAWIYLFGVVWCAVFVLLPLFNKDRLRAGDIVAGTWVILAPRQKMLRDIADDGAASIRAFDFTPAQLDVYGIKELAVLEEALRTNDRQTLKIIADRIAVKIGYERGLAANRDFLNAYYHALRGRLEARLLMGRRRADKFDR